MNTYEYHEFTRQPRNPNRQTLNSMIFRLPAWRKRRVCSGWQGSPEDKLIDEIFLKTTRMQFSLCRFLIRGDASFVALLLSRMPPEARKRSLLNSVKKVGVILSFHLFRIPFKKGEGRGKRKNYLICTASMSSPSTVAKISLFNKMQLHHRPTWNE